MNECSAHLRGRYLHYTQQTQDRQCASNVQLRHIHTTIVTIKKALSITYSDCVSLALGILPAMRMRYIAICGLSRCTTILHIFHKENNFQKEKILNIRCVVSFPLQRSSEIILILRKSERDMIKNLYGFHLM